MTAPQAIVEPTSADPAERAALMPADRLERVWAWGMSSSGMCYVYRPTTVQGLRDVFDLARRARLQVALRGAGRSYGDAAYRSENIVLDLTRMRRILDWNPETGIIRVEPGVTLEQLWQYTIEDGYWPAVVSGTMKTSVGGCAGMNVHGKNNFRAGPTGDHVLEFDLMLPSGEIRRCSREENADLFHAAIGGFGMLGCFTSLTLKLKKVHSGLLRVEPEAVPNLEALFAAFEERLPRSDYLVAWIDCFPTGRKLGRSLIHQANYLHEGEDPSPAQTLRVVNQELPDTIMGIVPKSMVWIPLSLFANDLGMRATNAAKFWAGSHIERKSYVQSHAAFAFLLDYVPNWKRAYGKGGLIQYQSFVPKEKALEVFRAEIELQHKHGLISYLGVFKRHRPDDFWMTHAVDGYSLALDFKVTEGNRRRLWQLAADMDAVVTKAGGRFYFAKDSTLHPSRLSDYLKEDRVARFLALKQECDPDEILQTDLYRRIFRSAGP